jgi:DNA-binding transcriptional LysR family regulator
LYHQSRIVFHHVARSGGFEAARPALGGLEISGVRRHVRALEREMGIALCRRQPFGLTPAGRMLYEHDRPHFEALALGALRLGRWTQRLRAGVTGSAAKRFLLPALATWLSTQGRMTIETRTGTMTQLLAQLKSGELDLLITALDGEPPAGFSSRTLATFPLVLLVPLPSPLRSAEELWAKPTLTELLITPEPDDPVTLAFERGLALGRLRWEPRFTHDCPSAVVRLVADGLGVGLALAAEPLPGEQKADTKAQKSGTNSRSPNSNLPSPSTAPGIRELPLAGFDPVPIAALWRFEDNLRLQEPLSLLHRLTQPKGA